MRGRKAKRAAAVAAVLAVLAGCSSSSHNSSSSQGTVGSSGGGGSSGSRGGTSTQITVSGLVTVADFGTGIDKVVRARFNQANNDAEIPGGRKINYLPAADDQGGADTNLSAVRRLVDQEHVFAVVPALSPFIDSGTSIYLNQQHVPLIGWGVDAGFCTTNPSSQYLFGYTGCLTP